MSERKIDEATMDNVEILAKLALTPQERQKAMDEMEKILTYVEKLNELDTDCLLYTSPSPRDCS